MGLRSTAIALCNRTAGTMPYLREKVEYTTGLALVYSLNVSIKCRLRRSQKSRTTTTRHFVRVRVKIFITVPPAEEVIHVFVGEEDRELALALYPTQILTSARCRPDREPVLGLTVRAFEIPMP
jgi:hypothetical protein